jgi:hypothetical protein
MLFPGNVHAGLAIGETDLQVPVPGRFHVWVQACPGCYAQQTVFPLATGGSFDENTQVGDVRRYRKPGNRPPLRFLHGPVGPGLELPPHSRFSAGASRRGHHLQFFVPLMGGWGASTFDFADPRAATWSLHQGRRTLARGHQVIAANVRVPPGPRTYRLLAHTHPGPAWDLSTHVSEVWTFGSRAGDMNVPLLTPHYLPPTNLAGDLGPGHTGFRLSFHSTPHSPRVAQVTVELSTNDGRSWHPVHTTRTSGLTFHVGYHNPAAHAGTRYASLRVTARDTQGNTVQETAFHAYRLG